MVCDGPLSDGIGEPCERSPADLQKSGLPEGLGEGRRSYGGAPCTYIYLVILSVNNVPIYCALIG